MTSALRFFLATFCALAPVLAQEEEIVSFHSEITIESTGDLTVRETIKVRATGDAIKRGIYRDFPTLYQGAGGLRLKVPFKVLTVQRDGRDEPFANEALASGRRLRIGRAEVFLPPGEHTYEITYRTSEQLGRFAEHDELYWNVTGNGWDFAIAKASATVILPGGAAVLEREAYTGPKGARGRNYRASTPARGVASFETTTPLAPREGLTIVVTWPKGFLAAAPPADLAPRYLRDNAGLIGGLLGLAALIAYYILTWLAVGKDPRKGPVTPHHEPPEGFSPAAARYLRRMRFDDTVFTTALISLAAKGALTIAKSRAVFVLQAVRNADASALTPDERQLLAKLFKAGQTLRLEQANHQLLTDAKQALRSSLALKLETHYFLRNTGFWLLGLLVSALPLLVTALGSQLPPAAPFLLLWVSFWSIGVAFLLSSTLSAFTGGRVLQGVFLGAFTLPFLAGEVFGVAALWIQAGGLVVFIFAVTVFCHAVFYHLLKRPTGIGREALDRLEGFREYLSNAGEERLDRAQPPEPTPQLFERFLPYAFALDADQAWSRTFDAALARTIQDGQGRARPYRPAWYPAASDTGTFSAADLSGLLGSAFSGAVSSASTAPGSSSGSGGGGSSGGGGGGGGGGGW
ncbi:MAG: DUF2207 domain-containing protein [Verrucomicrobia bacterium]|nr:DUF2207 domain-containing protein [Verrucomicrobiota bacterium]